MPIRSQLLAAFIGVTLLTLVVCGAVAYWLLPDATRAGDNVLLRQFSRQLGTELAVPAAQGKLSNNILDTMRRRITGTRTTVLVQNGSGGLMAAGAAHGALGTNFGDQLSQAVDAARGGKDQGQGELLLNHVHYLWASSAVPGASDVVTVLYPMPPADAEMGGTLGIRLLATGLIVMWVAVWAALVLSSIIARRLDEKNAALAHQARHDSLTGLPNRDWLYQHLGRLIGEAVHLSGRVGLLVMDLDRFKEVNDTLGHPVGDELIKMVGARVRAALRDGDLMARLGGDEFAIALPGAGRKQAVACAVRILRALEQPFEVDGLNLDVNASMGIAIYPDHGDAADTMIQHADTAMYKAKKAAVGYRFYNPSDDPNSLQRLTLSGELRSAIEQNQLTLHYQPKVDLQGRCVAGVEALVRWQHPSHGNVMPDDFIPLAEQTGLIRPLTDWVLNEAVRQCALWHRSGLNLSVAVNLSPHNLKDRRLPAAIGTLLQAWNVPCDALVLEITESAMMEDRELATEIVARLDGMGVRVAIDDFGTGFSSLAQLQCLRVHELKIDKSFVIGMSEDEGNTAIVRSIIDMAHNLGCQVVAEGVETAQILDQLQAMGCDIAQGYFLSRPLPRSGLEQWVADAPWGEGATAPLLRRHTVPRLT